MNSKDVERIVASEKVLELRSVVASNTTANTEDDSSPGGDVSRSGGDGYETSDYSRAETNSRPLAFQTVVNQAPGNSTNAGSEVGAYSRHDSAKVSRQGGARVEAKPSNPEKDGADDDMCNVMGAVVELLSTMTASLP